MLAMSQMFKGYMNRLIEWADEHHFVEISQLLIDFRDQPVTFLVPFIFFSVVVWFVFSKQFLRLIHALGVLVSPRKIQLKPLDLELKEMSAAAKRCITQFHKMGFVKLGSYHVNGGIVVVIFVKEGIGAAVYEQSDFAWYDIYAHFTDGSGMGVSNNIKLKDVLKPPNRDYVITDDDSKKTFPEFLSKLKQSKSRLHAIDAKNAVSIFEAVYADDMAWQKSQLSIKKIFF